MEVDPSGYSVLNPDNEDIVGIRMEMNGSSFSYLSEYYFTVNQSHRGNQWAPSISGRRALNTSKYLAAFYNDYSGAPNGQDIYYKQNFYNTSYNTLFRLGSSNDVSEVAVYPNPVCKELKFELPEIENTGYSILITDIQGKPYLREENIREIHYFWRPTDEVSPGIYFITITNNLTGQIFTQKIIKT